MSVYKKEGIKIVFWHLLPREQGLYLNIPHAEDYLRHLDRIYTWAGKHRHRIYALVVDIGPPNLPSGGKRGFLSYLKSLDRRRFVNAVPVFRKIREKIRAHGTLSVSTAMDLSAMDLAANRTGWQDLQGGPTLAVDWDFVSFMHFNSMNYRNLHRLLLVESGFNLL